MAAVDKPGYDPFGRGLVVSQSEAVGSNVPRTASTIFDAAGRAVKSGDFLSNWTGTTLDALGRAIQTTDPLGNVGKNIFNAAGELTASIDPLGFKSTFSYDLMGRQTVATDPRGKATITAYDNVGNVLSVTDPLTHANSSIYDALNRVSSSTDGAGGIVTTDLAGGAFIARDGAIGIDGNIVVAGNTGAVTGPPCAVGRYLATSTTINGVAYPAGSPDPTFGSNGLVTNSVGVAGSDAGMGIAIQPDGKIVVAGWAQVGSYNLFTMLRYLPSAPQIGSFTASPNPVTAGSSVTLTASNITDGNPNSTITQVAFYYYDTTGAKQILGYGTQSSPGVWTCTFTVKLVPGTYTAYAQAEDSFGVFGDPLALTLTVQ